MKTKQKLLILSTIATITLTGCVSDEDRNREMTCYDLAKKIGQLEAKQNDNTATGVANELGSIFGSSKKSRSNYDDNAFGNELAGEDIANDLKYYRNRYRQQGCQRH